MTTDHPGSGGFRLDAWRDLQLALRTAVSLQMSIRHADAKAAVLLGVQGGLATSVAESVPSLVHGPGTSGPATALLAATFLSGFLTTVWHTALTLIPRLIGPRGQNRFAFPNVVAAGRRPTPVGARRLRDEAWDLVSTLAGIAMVKHRHLRRGLLGLAMATLSAGGLHILAAVSSVA